jgi:predicted DNA-binding protein (MmcQ/YjbR family)
VFAIGGWGENKPAFSFKTSEQNYYFLQVKTGYRPAPYLAARGIKWIQQYDGSDRENEELKYYLTRCAFGKKEESVSYSIANSSHKCNAHLRSLT